MLSVEQALEELTYAGENNPGPWEQHSRVVAENARLIAKKIPGMDPEKAYVMGLLHDIGYRAGNTGMRHLIDGYEYLLEMEQEELADVCISHAYPVKNVTWYDGKLDCTQGQIAFLQSFIMERDEDDYDKLIQFCDCISLPEGACIAEKQFVASALRGGIQDHWVKRWRACLELKKYFDGLCGCCVYSVLPNVWENSLKDLV